MLTRSDIERDKKEYLPTTKHKNEVVSKRVQYYEDCIRVIEEYKEDYLIGEIERLNKFIHNMVNRAPAYYLSKDAGYKKLKLKYDSDNEITSKMKQIKTLKYLTQVR